MSKPPFEIIKDFEQALAEYTGAPFVTCVNSCTMALRLCLDWKYREYYKKYKDDIILEYTSPYIEIPNRTYVSVPIQIKQSGFGVIFKDIEWKGSYQLGNINVWDSARRFHAHMFGDQTRHTAECTYQCVSFHWTKILGLGHGGAILHDDPNAIHFFKEMRHDGRTEGMPIAQHYHRYLGHHCPISPEIAAQGLVRLASLPDYNEDLPNSDYPDLSTFEIFK